MSTRRVGRHLLLRSPAIPIHHAVWRLRDPKIAEPWWKGLRVAGTYSPESSRRAIFIIMEIGSFGTSTNPKMPW